MYMTCAHRLLKKDRIVRKYRLKRSRGEVKFIVRLRRGLGSKSIRRQRRRSRVSSQNSASKSLN